MVEQCPCLDTAVITYDTHTLCHRSQAACAAVAVPNPLQLVQKYALHSEEENRYHKFARVQIWKSKNNSYVQDPVPISHYDQPTPPTTHMEAQTEAQRWHVAINITPQTAGCLGAKHLSWPKHPGC